MLEGRARSDWEKAGAYLSAFIVRVVRRRRSQFLECARGWLENWMVRRIWTRHWLQRPLRQVRKLR